MSCAPWLRTGRLDGSGCNAADKVAGNHFLSRDGRGGTEPGGRNPVRGSGGPVGGGRISMRGGRVAPAEESARLVRGRVQASTLPCRFGYPYRSPVSLSLVECKGGGAKNGLGRTWQEKLFSRVDREKTF